MPELRSRWGLRGAALLLAWGFPLAPMAAPPLAGPDLSASSSAENGLRLKLAWTSILLDYELPGHSQVVGSGHAGNVLRLTLTYRLNRFLAFEGGVLGRLPFAHNFSSEIGAFPLLSVSLWPFGEALVLRLGSLETNHGFHPALVDEALYTYGRNLEELYHRSLLPRARPEVGRDPFLPVENGAQIQATLGPVSADFFLDWQLLETREHREKFAVGALLGYKSRFIDASAQFRLVHYGGQRYTAVDPSRRDGLDNKRQPTSFALTATPRPVDVGPFCLELPLSFVAGRVVQEAGGKEERHHGFEGGLDLVFFDSLRLGYRLWLPDDNQSRFVSEDSEPVYAGPRSHRARVLLKTQHGIAELAGRLDLVFAKGENKVQYLTVTTLRIHIEKLLWSGD